MTPYERRLAGFVATLAAAACHAQAQAPAAAAASAPAAAASAPSAAGTVTRTVIEDEGVRIEETRLRGLPQRITVHSKVGGAAPYEILVAPPGRDATQGRGAAGQRAWSIFDF
jgi:hypothetical protein